MTSRPNKRMRIGRDSLSHVKSFRSFGLSFHEKGDRVIKHSKVSSDGRRIHDRVVTAAPLRPRLHTTIQGGNDWMDFEDSAGFEPDIKQRQERMVFQIRKGRVIRVSKRKLFKSVSPLIFL